MLCSNCGTDNRESAKFCRTCGTSLTTRCASCGATYQPGQRFCDECGAALGAFPAASTAGVTAAPAGPASERRLVSVLFADLVGFTTLSERRDAEDVRELLSGYFDRARQVIERFGGTVEKFIGDAVMAVWGTPIAQEDDAERAVRAALDLVEVVTALGLELEAPDLRIRVGVLTGEAAVTLGASGQGMVAGDLVNTASRIQSTAKPGSVLVGDTTRRATAAAIAYDDAGEQALKGKAEPMRLWRATRVAAGRGGLGRSGGLEPRFVGRDRELRLVKDLFHGCVDERRAHLVSVVGVAGIGKTRLSWEFEKYIDGLVDVVLWHRGRCLPYGEGVAYWALAEMVRMRARIAEDEPASSAREKLRATVREHVATPEERSFVEPRLAHLMGIASDGSFERQDLFAAWRLFFERMAEQSPCVLVFEDLQWADSGLLDFIEYLLEWARAYPLYVVTLSRPELAERRPEWGAARRNFHAIFLEALPDAVMDELLLTLVPGLPDDVRKNIRSRADGVPLYAVETVRMLIDRGALESEAGAYRLTQPLDALDVPETLHALIAARLDGLSPDERLLVGDACVLGKTFTVDALVALSGRSRDELDGCLASLVRKEILAVEADPLSPELGQYGFLQALVQKVAHDTLSRHERKARHVAAARYFEQGWGAGDEEIVEVVAAHYAAAYEADPAAPDAPELRERARQALRRAGDRAASLGASAEAVRYFDQAAALADDDVTRAELLELAGEAAGNAAESEAALERLERAIAMFDAAGSSHRAARASAKLGYVLWSRGEPDTAIERLEPAFAVLARDEPDEDLATLAASLANLYSFTDARALAMERVEFALATAEALRLPSVISHALNIKSFVLERRPEESLTLLEGAVRVAEENGLLTETARSHNNLSIVLLERDRYEEARDHAQRAITSVSRAGDRVTEAFATATLVEALILLGQWDEALELVQQLGQSKVGEWMAASLPARIFTSRGEVAQARASLPVGRLEDVVDLQGRGALATASAIVLRAEGHYAESLAAAETAIFAGRGAAAIQMVKEGIVESLEAAWALGDEAGVGQIIGRYEGAPPAERTQYVDAHVARFKARLALARDDASAAEDASKQSVALFRELGSPFWLGVALVEHAERIGRRWIENGEEAESLAAEAGAIFQSLRATPWVARAARAGAGAPVT
jgi:class 3 adenylate cyclase/tetratricopeptide (TPR) repeat protein